jgi:N-acetylglucosamine transport system substrate-binding protein
MNKTLLLATALVLGLIAGCGGPSSSGATASEAPTGEGELKGDLEVMAFEGGYGIDMFQKAAAEFQELHPDLKITVSGNPRVWEQIRPRMVAGNPPDLMFPGWGMDHWALVAEDQLLPLDAALDTKVGDGTWRDTFDPNMLKLCQKDGKTYMLPYYIMVYGWWYDPGVFEKNGWTPPTTFSELLVLGDKMKAAGVAPMAFQGQYPYYMIEGMLFPWAQGVGGIQAIVDAQNLKPGAWNSPAFLKAAQMIDELNKKGFFLAGSTGMSHTESQTQFLNGKAAMVPCGSWIESEMKEVMPPGTSVEYMPVPFSEGAGDPTALLIGVEPWMVPVAAKNPNAAVALYKHMTSLEKAKEFVRTKGTLMTIKGSDEVELPRVLQKPAETVRNAKVVYANLVRQWYPEMWKEFEGGITSMLNGEITPQQFVDRCEAAAEKARQNKDLVKYEMSL